MYFEINLYHGKLYKWNTQRNVQMHRVLNYSNRNRLLRDAFSTNVTLVLYKLIPVAYEINTKLIGFHK